MNNLDPQYINLVKDILDNGYSKGDRTGTGTKSVFGRQISHKMSEGFPLLTTKKMPFKNIVSELLWFLRGDTDIRFLWKNNNHIWDGDWYKNYCKSCSSPYSLEEMIKFGLEFDENPRHFDKSIWDLGPIYGKQWRSWNTRKLMSRSEVVGEPKSLPDFFEKNEPIDQFQNLINDLKTNPDSRRLMVNAWNVGELDQMILPPCHYGFQVYTRELSLDERKEYSKKQEFFQDINGTSWSSSMGLEALDDKYKKDIHTSFDEENIPKRAISLMWNQRSVDTGLGLPFNIASYGLLLEIIAKMVNMVPDELIGNLGDTHIYNNHIEPIQIQLHRREYKLPKLNFSELFEIDIKKYGGDWENPLKLDMFINRLNTSDFLLENYISHERIELPLSN